MPTVNKLRGYAYRGAKYAGDYQAFAKAMRTGSFEPIWKRIGRRIAGRFTARLLANLFR